jgi:hypothetical protein
MSILGRAAACSNGTFDNCGFRIADCGLQRTAAITGSQISALNHVEVVATGALTKNACTMREPLLQLQTSTDASVDVHVHVHGLV